MKRMLGLVAFLGTLLLLTGCSKDENLAGPTTEGKGDLLLAAQVENACFVSTVQNLEQGSATNERAIETVPFVSASIYGDMVLISEYSFGDNIYRYDRGEGGELTFAGQLTIPPASFSGDITFVSATKAYVTLYRAGQIMVINPTEMTITKYIDISEYAVGDNCPDPAEMVIRDGKLFVGLHQAISMFAVHDSAFVLIIDVATDSVEKMITDDRTCQVGYPRCDIGMFVDDAGDIYVYGSAGSGYQPGSKDGFLRIKAGETEFDPGYFFSPQDISLPGVPGGEGAYIFGMVYTGGSTVYGCIMIPGWTSNPPDYVNDKNYQPFKIDLSAQTAEKIELSPSSGYSHGVCEYENKVVFGLSSVDGDGLYTYDLSTGTVSSTPVVTTVGMPMFIMAF